MGKFKRNFSSLACGALVRRPFPAIWVVLESWVVGTSHRETLDFQRHCDRRKWTPRQRATNQKPKISFKFAHLGQSRGPRIRRSGGPPLCSNSTRQWLPPRENRSWKAHSMCACEWPKIFGKPKSGHVIELGFFFSFQCLLTQYRKWHNRAYLWDHLQMYHSKTPQLQ